MAKPLNIVQLCNAARRIAAAECAKVGLPFETPVQHALASGLDVALTLMEQSGSRYGGLNRQEAGGIATYFREEGPRNASIDTQIAIWYQAWASVIESELNAGRSRATHYENYSILRPLVASIKGLNHILTITDQGRKPINLEELLGTTTIMAYIAAYVFPDANLFELRQRLLLAFVPLQGSIDTELLIERATSLAEVFRRPWTEPSDPIGPTI